MDAQKSDAAGKTAVQQPKDEKPKAEPAKSAQKNEKTKLEATKALDLQELRKITLQLDTYEDIFSDFDPRDYSKRELSEDFLKEVQRRYMEDKKGRFEVMFTLPSSERDAKQEVIIKKRLKEHFMFMRKIETDTIKKTVKRGYIYILIGALVLLANIYVYIVLGEQLLAEILAVILVPAGWYGMFTGIGKVVDEPENSVEKRMLYEKLARANYVFISDEQE